MSSAAYRGDNGKLEYAPCCSVVADMLEEATSSKPLYPERTWLDDKLDELDEIYKTYELDVEFDESYTEREVLDMLADQDIHPYRHMGECVNTAVRAVLKEHPEARIREIDLSKW